MRYLLLTAALAAVLAGGCDWYFGEESNPSPRPDAGPPIPDAAVIVDANPNCVSDEQRDNGCSYDLTGTVIDFTTREASVLPGVQLQLDVTTAWDTIPFFPAGCPPLATIPVSGSGYFELFDAPCGSPLEPPIALFLVDDSGTDLYAATASDKTLECPSAPQCAAVSTVIPVPRKVVVDDWRAQLLADGMPDADTRGLVLYQYLATDDTPAPGVQPTILDGISRRFLTPRTEVRFLAADRLTLIPADATITGVSGWAIVGVDRDVAFVGGEDTGGALWDETGTLLSPGWIFVEENWVDTP